MARDQFSIQPGQGLHALAEDLWFCHERFRFMGVVQIYNNCLLIRVPPSGAEAGSAEPFLIAVNPVALSDELAEQIAGIERETNAPLRFYIGTDWHHMSAEAWARRWPGAVYIVPSVRPLSFRRACFREHENALIVSREAPVIPDAAHVVTLLPWLGFAHPPTGAVAGEKRRGEVSVWHEPTRTLFLFDPIIPIPRVGGALGQRLRTVVTGTDYAFKRNFGPFTGFRVLDPTLAEASMRRLASLPANRLVCSHGRPEDGALIEDAEAVRRVLLRAFSPALRHNSTDGK